MKKIICLLVSAFALCTFNVYATNPEEPVEAKENNSPVKCEFSLNHYTGNIYNGNTQYIMVRLNCVQTEDVTATVYVYIDNELVASDLYTIKKGQMNSHSPGKPISVGKSYDGKKYKLDVR